MKIVAFDPGGTTGIAVGIWRENSPLQVSARQIVLSHIGLYEFLVQTNPDWVINESFKYRNRARSGLELISAELIGVIKLYVAQYKPGHIEQTPSEGIGGFFGNPKKLKEDELWQEGNIHAMEALMHLLHWYTFKEGYQYNTKGYVKA